VDSVRRRRSGSLPPLELWGGVECTVNRVRKRYFDQLQRTGFDRRLEDLEAIAELGVRALRFPVLWERTAARASEHYDWSWSDARLARLRELGITPIVGLLHHGSGPAYTNLLDPEFPVRFANYAGAVARRYPWIDMYTPINEPLTTARFSGLYGFWYPHERSDVAFCRALVNQCRAIQLAMREIRRVNPSAWLLQTEDLGLTSCTPALIEQADFENARHLLAYDLLCGRVDRGHPLYRYVRDSGIAAGELELLRAEPPPDMLGANHYITSVRLLDERVKYYRAHQIGGNGRHRYADIEAVRASVEGFVDPTVLLRRLWVRYGIPLAITEVHLGCDAHEQIRWFKEMWDCALRCRERGIDLRAVTAWSLFGAFDWHCMVTREHNCYEAGAFDVSGDAPVRTELGDYLVELGQGRGDEHPALEQPGWWRRADRLLYPPVRCYPFVRCNDSSMVRLPDDGLGAS
jgi:dTDP-4-dehydrorhamnose reductase